MVLKNKIIKDILIFLVFWLLYAIIATSFVLLPVNDWLDYHYYNSWQFLTNRYNMDFMAANFRSYFPPFIDIPQYLLINKLNNHPFLFIFIEQFDNAFFVFIVYKIINFLLDLETVYEKRLCTIFSIVYIFLSPIMFKVLNFGYNDAKISSLVALSVYIILKNVYKIHSLKRDKAILLSGIILGFALGLKYTVCVYVLALILCFFFLRKRIEGSKSLIINFIIGVAISFLLVDGYWWLFLYKHFGNPLFPYFNEFFHSPYVDLNSLFIADYSIIRPKNVIEFIFYPFMTNNKWFHGFSDPSIFDIRYAFAYIAVFILGLKLYLRSRNIKNYNYITKAMNDENLAFLLLLLFNSCVINLLAFGLYRFVILSSALFGLLMVCLVYSFKDKVKLGVFIVLLLLVYLSSNFGKWNHFAPFNTFKKSKIVSYHDLNIENGANVILISHAASYSIVKQNANAHYYSFVFPSFLIDKYKNRVRNKDFLATEIFYSNYLENKIKNIVQNEKNVYFIMSKYDFYIDYDRNFYEESIKYYYDDDTAKFYNCKDVDFATFGVKKFWERGIICQVETAKTQRK